MRHSPDEKNPARGPSTIPGSGIAGLTRFVQDEFEAYLKCGLLEHGFLRVKCDSCQTEKLVAFSCKRRGFCPSWGARRMADTSALLVDGVLGIVYRTISGHLIRQVALPP